MAADTSAFAFDYSPYKCCTAPPLVCIHSFHPSCSLSQPAFEQQQFWSFALMNSLRSDASICSERAEGNAVKGKGRRIRKSRPRHGNDDVKMKVQKLQELIPGGHNLKTERLLSHTADYIVHMRFQVNLLQALIKLHPPHPPDD